MPPRRAPLVSTPLLAAPLLAAPLLAALLMAAGCSSDRPKTIPVQGQVTFQGAPPPVAGRLMFAPIEPAEGYIRRPAWGEFDAQGKLVVTSFDDGDGIVPGRYEVKIECWRVSPTEESPGESHVPAGFQIPELDVAPNASGPIVLNIDVR